MGEVFAEGVQIVLGGSHEAVAAAEAVLGGINAASEQLLSTEVNAEETPRLAAYLGEAQANLILAASAVLASVEYKCTLANPPEDIRARPGPNGNMVHRCFHGTPHCWDGSWQLIPC